MALRFIESFDTYGTANLTEGRWTATAGFGAGYVVSVSPGNGRRGTACCRLQSGPVLGGQASLSKTLDRQPTWIVGFAFKRASFTDSIDICSFR